MAKHFCTILLVLLAWQMRLLAVPAKPVPTTVTQSDGTTLTVRLCGDEYAHWYETSDGIPLVKNDGGDYCYAVATSAGLASSGVVAHEKSQRTATELRHATAARRAMPKAGSTRRHEASRRRAARRTAASRNAYVGQRRGLVIMAEFPDRKFLSDDSHSQWNDILNENGYSENGAMGCVSDYFRDQSAGLFNIQFDLVGPVTVAHERSYYGENDPSWANMDKRVDELVAEACQAVAGSVNFEDYDWNGDGYVDMVYIIYAGGGEHVQGNDSALIWPHEYYVSAYGNWPNGYEIGGVFVDMYACSSELGWQDNDPLGRLSGLGTFCHEFSHCLGLPDLYTYSGLDMLSNWDLMSNGSYNNDSWCPAGYSAYEKMACGWADPVVLDADTAIHGLQPMGNGGVAYMVRNDAADEAADEYYLLENRQQAGWDTYVPGSGLTITHIDYDEETWWYNTVNDAPNHPGVAIIPASGIYTPDANVAYPYAGNDSLTDNSTPAAIVYNANKAGTYYMGKPITGIRHDEANGTVSFNFANHNAGQSTSGIAAPKPDPATGHSAATVYDLQGRKIGRTDAEGRLDANVPAGIYIIKEDNGKTQKITNR